MLKKVFSVIQKNWEISIVLFITFILELVIVVPFVLYNSLDNSDAQGVISAGWFIKNYRFPDFQGWNPYFFAGFPQGIFYPPLFHYVLAFVAKIIGLESAYKLIIALITLFIPISIHKFSNSIIGRPWSLSITLLVLLFMVISPWYLGMNFKGAIETGLAPSFATIPLFFLFLSELFKPKINYKMAGLFLSLIILTNLVTAFFSVFVLLIFLLTNFRIKSNVTNIFKIIILTTLLTAFWIVPYMAYSDFSASGVPTRISKYVIFGSVIIGLILCLPAGFSKLKDRKLITLAIASLIILFFCLFDSLLNISDSRFSIDFINSSRLFIFPIYFFAVFFIIFLKNSHKLFIKIASKFKVDSLFRNYPHIKLNQIALLTLVILASAFFINSKGPEKVVIKSEADFDGRFIRGYKVSEVTSQSRALIDKLVMENPDSFAVDGLLKESSYLAPYFQSLSKSMNRSNFDFDSLDSHYIENVSIPDEKTKWLAELLWVKNVLTINEEFPDCSSYSYLTSFKSNSFSEQNLDRNFYLCRLKYSSESKIAELLESEVNVIEGNWDDSLNDWWSSSDLSLFSDKEVPVSSPDIKDMDIDVEFSKDFQSIKVAKESPEESIVLLKVGFFPKWKAYDEGGEGVEIYRISPNLMAFKLKNEVILKYERSGVEWISLVVSIICWIILTVYFIIEIFFHRKLKK